MSPTLGVNHFFDDKDLGYLSALIEITKLGLSLQEARSQLHERVLLDPSFQGWTTESFRDQEKIEILRDFEYDPNGLAARGIILLGYYRRDTRSKSRWIVLFPNAIRLVSERMGLDEDVLTRVVLVHELAHWFTLDETPNRFGGMESGLWPNEFARPNKLAMPSEYAETLAELVSWLVFNTQAAKDMSDNTEHLRQQYLLNESAPHHAYQLYWFWLVAAGVARELNDLRDECVESINVPGVEDLRKWIRGGGFHGDLLTNTVLQVFLENLAVGKELLEEGFVSDSRSRNKRFEGWEQFLRNRNVGIDDDLLRVRDI